MTLPRCGYMMAVFRENRCPSVRGSVLRGQNCMACILFRAATRYVE